MEKLVLEWHLTNGAPTMASLSLKKGSNKFLFSENSITFACKPSTLPSEAIKNATLLQKKVAEALFDLRHNAQNFVKKVLFEKSTIFIFLHFRWDEAHCSTIEATLRKVVGDIWFNQKQTA